MKNVFKVLVIVTFMVMGSVTEASAQGFFKKLKKAVGTVTNVVTNPIGTATKALVGESASQDESSESEDEDEKPSQVDQFINDPMSFSVAKVTAKDEDGNVLKNDDGTEQYRYLLLDQNGNVCNAETARKMVNSRLKSIGTVVAKVGGGAALGALTGGLLSDKKLKAKNIIGGGLTGALAGLAASVDDIAKIKQINTALKNFKETIAVYQKNVTEEGTPIDASVDLAKLFPDAESVEKSSSEIDAEMAKSKELGGTLEDVDPDAI